MDSWMRQPGALIGTSRARPEAFDRAVDEVVAGLGYTPAEDGDLVLFTYRPPRGGWITGRMEAGLARVIARTGVPRLDALLTQIRFGAAAEVAIVEGRAAVRVKGDDGSTITTFVTPEELARLRELAPMLRG